MYGFSNNHYQQGYSHYMGQPYGQNNQQTCQITRVNGRNGAEAFRMAPNSSILLLADLFVMLCLPRFEYMGKGHIVPLGERLAGKALQGIHSVFFGNFVYHKVF